MIEDNIKKKILKEAVSLKQFGLNDLAWKKKDAINLIYSIIPDKIGILGGDVYQINLDNLSPTYDNWFTEPKNGESMDNYFFRSKVDALNYIKDYEVGSNNIFFSIVFTESFEW